MNRVKTPHRRPYKTHSPRSVNLWKPEQVWMFVEAADEMGRPSMGTLALLCFDLCERPSDMFNLTWLNYWQQGQHWKRRNITTHVTEAVGHKTVGYFDFRYIKTNTVKHIPASAKLVERLNNTRKSALNDLIIYNDRNEMPLNMMTAGRVFKQIQKHACLSDTLQMRDLRMSGLKLSIQVPATPEETTRDNACHQ